MIINRENIRVLFFFLTAALCCRHFVQLHSRNRQRAVGGAYHWEVKCNFRAWKQLVIVKCQQEKCFFSSPVIFTKQKLRKMMYGNSGARKINSQSLNQPRALGLVLVVGRSVGEQAGQVGQPGGRHEHRQDLGWAWSWLLWTHCRLGRQNIKLRLAENSKFCLEFSNCLY